VHLCIDKKVLSFASKIAQAIAEARESLSQ
jgi:hypothetical protein